MGKFVTITVLFFASLLTYSQNLTVQVFDPPIEYTNNMGDWGTDLVAFNSEPFGRVSGLVRPTDTIYIAVPDTVGLTGGGVRIIKSSNNGANWLQTITVSGAGIIPKTRMVRSGLDTIYCLFQVPAGNNIYILKVNYPLVNPLRLFFTGSYRDFDVFASSTGGLYVFPDSLGSNNIPRYGSTDGGITWVQRGLVTSTAAHPFLYKSGTGDTAILMYYQAPTGADTTTSAITVARYRESGPGQLSSIAFLTSIIPAGAPKDQFMAAKTGAVAWVVYTSGAPGSRDIMCRVSTDGGVTYGSDVPLANRVNVDEYWFDVQHYSVGAGGADFIYYYDSTGGPSNTTDKILYTSASTVLPSTFTSAVSISEHYPQPSTRGYIPLLTEFYNVTGNAGALWVGLDVSTRRLYFDRIGAPPVGIVSNNQVPEIYSLSQNYPNPFNPTTKIDFAIPKDGNVSLKIYNLLGSEVASLVDKDFKAGSYTVDYDASNLSSGVYFYKLISGSFVETKKMILVK